MNSKSDEYRSHLERLWHDRVNLPRQSQAYSDFKAKVSLFKYMLSESESEQTRLETRLEQVEREQERLQARISMLEGVLTKYLRKPWLSVRDALNRRLAYYAWKLVRPISEDRAMRFKNSANKRDPRRYISSDRTAQMIPMVGDRLLEGPYDLQTKAILERYFPPNLSRAPQPLYLLVGSAILVRNRSKLVTNSSAPPWRGSLAFSIITPFFSHLGFFADCAKSVAALAEQTAQSFEWVIVNDDPSVADDMLLQRIPNIIRKRVRVLSDGKNHGITRALNRGISAATTPWVVLLDCDDMLEPNALDILASAIEDNPECRYFSSLMIDIDEAGQELRRRRINHDFIDLFEVGMIGGHMVAFRRDLYEELGGFDHRFSGVQDYDFALRVIARERIRRIPQHLYRYRWHSKTQSVSRIERQAQLTNAVRVTFLSETMAIRPEWRKRPPLPERPEIFCIMRTQGTRMELLAAALDSVRAQALPVTPCVVVHGDNETVDFVERHLQSELGEENYHRPVIILQASELGRRRGYPCNVALNYLRLNASRYDLVCFLDDDDHFLPNFAERLTRLIKLTGVDMAYGMANALPKNGEPHVQHKLRPWLSVLAGNFITFNSFIVRTDAVLEANVTFDEDMHYLEDHDFLVQLLGAGIQARPLPEVISEYRLIGDGNAEIKLDTNHFKTCQEKLRWRSKEAARSLSSRSFWADILYFPAQDRPPFDEGELRLLLRTRDMLKRDGCHE